MNGMPSNGMPTSMNGMNQGNMEMMSVMPEPATPNRAPSSRNGNNQGAMGMMPPAGNMMHPKPVSMAMNNMPQPSNMGNMGAGPSSMNGMPNNAKPRGGK
jgi:hypothetical protein